MDLSRVEVVLVRPARAANVAAACRALKNMGLTTLRLVEAPQSLVAPEARALAYGAWDVLDGARRHASLLEAVRASTLVVATTGRALPEAVSPRELATRMGELAHEGRLSIVFGPEASGLTGVELSLCHRLVHVPTDPACPSMNLAQAVLLLAYELRLASLGAVSSPTSGAPVRPAPAGELEHALAELRAGLLGIGYLHPDNPNRILTELRRLLARAAPTPRELNLLRGIARQMAWAGRIARERSGSDNATESPAMTSPEDVTTPSGQAFYVPRLLRAAEVVCADGRVLRGRVFLPAAAESHTGAVRMAEWLEEPGWFFPFLPDGEGRPVLLSKEQLIVATVAADVADEGADASVLRRRIRVECGVLRLEGDVLIDMPASHSRVLDLLNRAGDFLTLRSGDHDLFVRKSRIVRVTESGAARA